MNKSNLIKVVCMLVLLTVRFASGFKAVACKR